MTNQSQKCYDKQKNDKTKQKNETNHKNVMTNTKMLWQTKKWKKPIKKKQTNKSKIGMKPIQKTNKNVPYSH